MALADFQNCFSKRQSTQPQLSAFACPMHDEEWTFQESEIRLGGHRELRQLLGLSTRSPFTEFHRFLKHLDGMSSNRAFHKTVQPLSRREGHVDWQAQVTPRRDWFAVESEP